MGGFSLDQLMELAGLSVSQAGARLLMAELLPIAPAGKINVDVVYRFHPPSKGKNILVVCGPGNNGPVVLALPFSPV